MVKKNYKQYFEGSQPVNEDWGNLQTNYIFLFLKYTPFCVQTGDWQDEENFGFS